MIWDEEYSASGIDDRVFHFSVLGMFLYNLDITMVLNGHSHQVDAPETRSSKA